MKNLLIILTAILTSFGLGRYVHATSIRPAMAVKTVEPVPSHLQRMNEMKLGAFSVSLNVKNLEVSKRFYEHLGFKIFGGSMEQNYLIMKNEHTLIGIFQGMFEGNILTFNPGWDDAAQNIDSFDDVRDIQRQLKSKGVTLLSEANEQTKGPASLMLKDPDGNMIYVDQHR